MYRVLCDDILICDSRIEELALLNPTITLEENKAGSFSFTLPPTHPEYKTIKKRKNLIQVYFDEEVEPLFSGICVDETHNFYNHRKKTCEGELTFFNDTIQRPRRYQGKAARELLESYVAIHNAQVEENKRFIVGAVTVKDNNDYISCYTNMETTMTALKEDLVDDLGGFFRVRHPDGKRYLDYLADSPNVNSQPIVIGENLLDFTQTMDTTDIATAIIPLGMKLEESIVEGLETRLTIADINNGVDYVYSQEAVDTYGWIYKTVVWDDVTTATALKAKAEKYLSDTQWENMVIEAKAIDLYLTNKDIERFKISDQIRVISPPHGLDRYFVLSKMTIPLNNPENSMIVLGKKEQMSLSTKTNQVKSEIKKVMESIVPTSTILNLAKQNASEIIKFASEGNVHTVYNEQGKPIEICIMDTDDINTAQRVWRWNMGGLAYSKNGYNGDYELAITMDGAIVANFITTGVLNASLITAGILKDKTGNNYWDFDKGEFSLKVVEDIKNTAIASVDVEYALGDSQTTAPESGWQTTSPTWTDGKYIWQRTKTTNGNGEISYSKSVCIQGTNGKDGTDGVGVKGIVNYYLATSEDTGVTTSTSGWTTDVQSVSTDKKYLWNYEKVTYTNDNIKSTEPCIIGAYGDSGKDGTNGKDGATGNGISSIQEYYAVSTSNSIAPTSWDTTVPTMTSTNKYLWNYEEIIYTNGDKTETSKRVIGVYGDQGIPGTNGTDGVDGKDGTNGKDGRDGKDGTSSYIHIKYSSVENPTDSDIKETPSTYIGVCVNTTQTDPTTASSYTWSRFAGKDGEDGLPGTNGVDGTSTYVHFAYATSSDGSKEFSTSWFEKATYLGACTDNTLADPTSYTAYAWNLIKGKDGEDGKDGTDGADGKDGIGISAIEEQYYLSTSNTEQAGGEWSTTCPAWEKNHYIWTRSHITWSDNSETYTTPVLANAINGANQGVSDLDTKLNQTEIFNRLTNSGASKGVFMKDGQLYINASYIASGILKLGGLNNTNGTLEIYDASGNIIGEWNKDGISTISGEIGGWNVAEKGIYNNDLKCGFINAGAFRLWVGRYTYEQMLQMSLEGDEFPYFGVTEEGMGVVDRIMCMTDGQFNGDCSVWGTLYTASGTVSASDSALKKDVKTLDLEESAEFIYSLIPKKYKYTNGTSGRFHHGFIAQDVKGSMTEDWGLYVDSNPQEDGHKALRYEEIIADLVATVQTLNKRVQDLEEERIV